MESTTPKIIKDGQEFNHLFPKTENRFKTIKRGANVIDTVQFIPKVVKATLYQTKNIAPLLKGKTVYDTCKNIWHFLYEHVKYKKDEDGLEQVREPARLWKDRKTGVDCDCFTTTILSLLTNCGIETAMMRITKYKQNHFQHIYPIVPLSDGTYITMDCVVNKFNYEEPYSEKKDFKMDLQVLSGMEETDNYLSGVDAQDLFGWNEEMGELGKLFNFRQKNSVMPEENQGDKKGKKGFQKVKNIAKKALNVVNKANPATALLRAGILASMKLNIFKVAQRLKWAYLTEDEARKKGVDIAKFSKLKNVLYKIEQIFYTAGGNSANLKKAILSGKGNKNKEVNGFGLIDYDEIQFTGISEQTALSELLGDMYSDEFVNGTDGLEGLGELGSATAAGASVAAATSVMATIAALLKSVGNLFPKNKSNDFTDAEQSDNNLPNVSISDSNAHSPSSPSNSNTSSSSDDSAESIDESDIKGETKSTKSKETGGEKEPKGFKKFWEENKKWMKPVGIGLAVAGVFYAGYKIMTKQKETPKENKNKSLNGFHHKQKKRKKGKRYGNDGKKTAIALM